MCKGVNKGEGKLVEIIEKKQSKRTKVPIDECMAPLIKELNKFGFETQTCCCGHGHVGHLQLEFGEKINNVLVKKNAISIEFKG